MSRLYRKSEIWFAVAWIIVYVVGSSIADGISSKIGTEKSISFVFHLMLSLIALVWLKKEGLFSEYGLCKPNAPASAFLYYLPLAAAASCNLWFGICFNYPPIETLFYVGSMLCVGFLEELVFRGFLFKAMSRDNLRSAIIVSSVTFGIGHIVNLFNGSGADLLSNLCQVGYAIAFGFLFVIIFHRSKSLLPCIITHSAINSISVFLNKSVFTGTTEILVSLALAVISVTYTLILLKTLPKEG